MLEQRGQQRVAQGGEGEVTPGQLSDGRVAVIGLVAQESQLVFVMATAIDPAGVGEHGAGLANQVQRHVGQGDIFLEDGGVAAPFANALAQNQAGIA